MVKLTNPDENVNHLPAVGKYTSEYSDGSNVEPDESNKRLFLYYLLSIYYAWNLL